MTGPWLRWTGLARWLIGPRLWLAGGRPRLAGLGGLSLSQLIKGLIDLLLRLFQRGGRRRSGRGILRLGRLLLFEQ